MTNALQKPHQCTPPKSPSPAFFSQSEDSRATWEISNRNRVISEDITTLLSVLVLYTRPAPISQICVNKSPLCLCKLVYLSQTNVCVHA